MLDRTRSLYFDYQPYPFARPAELAGADTRHAVAIVGAGPVGLAVALGLARRGIASVVVEADDMESTGSRAACVSRRSMEILQGLGIIDAFEGLALPWTSGRTFYAGKVIYRLEMPHSDDERYFPMANLQQNFLERMMLEAAACTGLIDVRWHSRLTGFDEDAGVARLLIETPEGAYTLAADWVVAADGARSTMRRLMGLKLAGTAYSGHYLIADIELQTDHPIERRAWFDSKVNRGSTILMHKQPKNIWRVDYQLRPEDDPDAELDPARIRTRVQDVLDMAGEAGAWRLDWYSLYSASCLALDRYDHGRVFFAGDAAHLVPIFGVRGLNSGLADADNLAWKLAATIRGTAGEGLLASYTPERRGATLEIFREADKSTNYMTPPTPGYALMRQASLSLALSEPWAGALANPRQSAPHTYADSPLNTWSEHETAFTAGPAIGAPALSVKLAGGGFLTDHLTGEATAIAFLGHPRDAETVDALTAADRTDRRLKRILVGGSARNTADGETVVADPDGRVAAAYGAASGTIYLLRPDWHVAARRRDPPDGAAVAAAVDRLWGLAQ